MASRSANTARSPVKLYVGDALFVCSCGGKEFKVASHEDGPLHYFCKCGQIYTERDLQVVEE